MTTSDIILLAALTIALICVWLLQRDYIANYKKQCELQYGVPWEQHKAEFNAHLEAKYSGSILSQLKANKQ